MPRIRTLKPEIVEDERTASLTDSAFRLFVSLIVLADDHGNTRGEEWWLRSRVWGARRESPRIAEVLRELATSDLVLVYSVRGQTYLHICGWEKHQRIDNRGRPVVPGPKDPECQMVSVGEPDFVPEPPRTSANLREIPPDQDQDQEEDQDQDQDQGGSPDGARGSKTPVIHRPVVDAFHGYYLATHDNAKPTWGAKQIAQIKKLTKAHGADEVTRRIGILRAQPPAWPQPPWDLATFVAHFDKLAVPAPSPRSGSAFFDGIDQFAREVAQ